MNLFKEEKTNISFRVQNYILNEVDRVAKEYNVSRNKCLNNLLTIALAELSLNKKGNDQ